ncbi:cell division cycle protein 27 homolog isoform X2 [Halichondria panicea]|uniref:cell division cycle protein 27 homolog isoform X2 n=1 Tax=Halichondria panicea TaxID=6063 RepID=UPI00312B3AB6
MTMLCFWPRDCMLKVVSSTDTSYLLATCYYRSGRVQQAKHHLSKEGVLSHPHCSLLYAQCCLTLKQYKSGLVALHGLLCLGEVSESNFVHRYGNETGVALHLLGMLNLRLNQTKEAVRHFRAALKYNPFLWSAFEKLCDLGEPVSASECFTMTAFPAFLRHSHYPHTSTHPPPSQPQGTHTITHNTPIDPAPTSNAFTVDPSLKHTYVTPGLFAQPTLGKAIASSTPSSLRTISFPHEPIPFRLGQDTMSVDRHLKDHASSGVGVLTDPKMVAGGKRTFSGDGGLSVVRGVLDFGSASVESGRVMSKTAALMPLTPSFGVLNLTTPTLVTPTEGVPHSLNFDSVTPSPTPLPPDYLNTIVSAPRSNKGLGRKSLRLPSADRQSILLDQSETTTSPDARGSEFTHPLMHSTTVTSSASATNQMPARESVTTPPRTTPPGTGLRIPPKSSLSIRRSARLAGGKRDVQSTRGKSRSKISSLSRRTFDPSLKKVTFSSPSLSGGGKHDDRLPPSSKVARLATPAHTPSNRITSSQHGSAVLRGVKENVCEGVRTESESVKTVESSEETLAKRQAEVEQAAMTGLNSLMQLLVKLGSAYHSLSLYNLGQAIEEFETIAPHHSGTAWVTSQLARAYFAGERFKQSAKLYGEVHAMDPHRQEGMELYSSALCHLQKDVQLSVVAEALHSSDKTSPRALCAMASIMNRYKDHTSAIKYLQRAIQVCPQFEYAHTLLGLEWWITKDFDKALTCFQEAVTINPRHYNAWYGLSHVHYTQEKYSFAEIYAVRALTINKCSSIACTQTALAKFQQKQYPEALASLNRAIAINSTNPIPQFHRAKVLEVLNREEEAIQQLDKLAVIWPTEPNLYVSKGKILQKLNRMPEAILHFSWARDFGKTETSGQMREEIDQVYYGGGEGEEEELDTFTVDEDVNMDSGED